MITYNEALDALQKMHPELKPTGKAYKYDDAYFIEMADKNIKNTSIILDGYYRIDGKSKEIRPFMIYLDGAQDPLKMDWL